MVVPITSKTIIGFLAVLLFEATSLGQSGDVRIGRMPNPSGLDEENEAITLINRLDSEIDLTGWTLKNKRNDSVLNGLIGSKGEITKNIGKKFPLLNNSGDTISLFDPDGTLQDSQVYTKNQVATGSWITFFVNDQIQPQKSLEEDWAQLICIASVVIVPMIMLISWLHDWIAASRQRRINLEREKRNEKKQ